MKRIFFAFTLILWNIFLFAQKEYLPTPEDLAHFYDTRTYVVLEASPMSDYNFEVKEVMDRVWNITDFEFIKQEEFPEKSKDPNASFIYTSLVNFEHDKTDSRYVFLHLRHPDSIGLHPIAAWPQLQSNLQCGLIDNL